MIILALALAAIALLATGWTVTAKNGVRWSEEQHAREEARAAARAAAKAGRA